MKVGKVGEIFPKEIEFVYYCGSISIIIHNLKTFGGMVAAKYHLGIFSNINQAVKMVKKEFEKSTSKPHFNHKKLKMFKTRWNDKLY